jgi:ATP-binding cassette subfamily F protein uup
MSLIAARGVVKRFGARRVLDGVSLAIEPKARIGLIGANGAGKSTLISILVGADEPDEGEVIRRRGLSFARVEQFPQLDPEASVESVLAQPRAHQEALLTELGAIERELARGDMDSVETLLEAQAACTARLEAAGGWNVEHVVDAAASALRVPPKDRRIGTLSLGERRRLALAVALAEPRDLLVLDEPTNHLDVDAVEWLETTLVGYPGAVLLVSHDRLLLDGSVDALAELDRGDLRLYPGNYTAYLVARAERYAQDAESEEKRQRAIANELTWARASAPARTTKQKARLDRLDALMAARPKRASGEARLRIPHPPRIGKTILELEGVGLSFGDRVLIRDLDLILSRGDRFGIVGPNGAGKTTLIRAVLDELEPSAGRIVRGQNTRPVYADQGRTVLNDEDTVLEAVAGDGDHVTVGEEKVPVHGYLAGLMFEGAAQKTKVGALSGGERSRVALARCLAPGGNLIILDEPTNDLDLPTLRVLEEALVEFPGCALIVSHDRAFLDRVATAILAFEDGRVVRYEGGYSDYKAKRAALVESRAAGSTDAERVGATPAVPPTRAKEKKKRSYKEEREFETIEARILEAEASVEALEARLADPAEIVRLGAGVEAVLAELERAKAEVERLYARWEVLGALG